MPSSSFLAEFSIIVFFYLDIKVVPAGDKSDTSPSVNCMMIRHHQKRRWMQEMSSIRTIFLTRRVGKEEEDAALLIIRRLLWTIGGRSANCHHCNRPLQRHSAHPAPPALAPPRCCEPRPGGRSTCHPARTRPRRALFDPKKTCWMGTRWAYKKGMVQYSSAETGRRGMWGGSLFFASLLQARWNSSIKGPVDGFEVICNSCEETWLSDGNRQQNYSAIGEQL